MAMLRSSFGSSGNEDEIDGFGRSRDPPKFSTRRFWSTTSVLEMATAYNRNFLPAIEAAGESESSSSSSELPSDDQLSSSGDESIPTDDEASSAAVVRPSLSLPDLAVASRRATVSGAHFRPLRRQANSHLIRADLLPHEGNLRRRPSIECLVETMDCGRDRSSTVGDAPLRLMGFGLPTWSQGLSPPNGKSHERAAVGNATTKKLSPQASPSSAPLSPSSTQSRSSAKTGDKSRPRPVNRRPSYVVAIGVDRELEVSDDDEQEGRIFSSFRRRKDKRQRAFSEQPASLMPLEEKRRSSVPFVFSEEDEPRGTFSGPATPTGSRRGSMAGVHSPLLRRIMSPFQRKRISLPVGGNDDPAGPSSGAAPAALTRKQGLSNEVRASQGVLNRLGLSPMMTRRLKAVSLANEGEDNEVMTSFLASPPIRPFHQSILEVDVRYIAEELTLIDAELEKGIEARELINCAWMSNARNTVAPNVMKMVDHFNHLALITTSEVLRPVTAAERAKVIGFWIKVAEECLKLQNFNSLKAILAGLQCTPMFRLKRTWKEVSPNKKKRFTDLSELMAEERNYAAYRQRMEEALQHPPCLPFLGVFLTQITQMDAFNKLHGRRLSRRTSRRLSRRQSRQNSLQHGRSVRKMSLGSGSTGNVVEEATEAQKVTSPTLSSVNTITEETSLEDGTPNPGPSNAKPKGSTPNTAETLSDRKSPASPASIPPDRESSSPEANGQQTKTVVDERASIGEDSAYGSDVGSNRTSYVGGSAPKRPSPVEQEKAGTSATTSDSTKNRASPRSSPMTRRMASVDSTALPPAHPPVSRSSTSPALTHKTVADSRPSHSVVQTLDRIPKSSSYRRASHEVRTSICQISSNALSWLDGGLAGQRVSIEMSLEEQLNVYRSAASAYHHCSRPWVRYVLEHISYNTEEENYKLSLQREPRLTAKPTWRDRLKAH